MTPRKISACAGALMLALLTERAYGALDRQALSSWFTGLKVDKVVHAINCGSNEEIQDLLGVNYVAVSIDQALC